MRDIRNIARQRWRQTKRRNLRREAVEKFLGAFFFGAVLATLAAIVLHR
jgi:hypothetical protein